MLIDRYKQGQWFSEILRTIWRTGTKFQVPFQFINLLQLLSNLKKIKIKNGELQLLDVAKANLAILLY